MISLLLIILMFLVVAPVISLSFYLWPYLGKKDGDLHALREALFYISLAKAIFLFSEILILILVYLHVQAATWETVLLIASTALLSAVNWYAFFVIKKIQHSPNRY